MKNINYIKTLYYNFRFWGFKGLIKLPLIVHRGVVFKDTEGTITLADCMRRGALRFGSAEPLAIADMKYQRTIIDISGNLVVHDNVHIATGSRISINQGATLSLGRDFNTTGNCTIICDKAITFGHSCLLSWDILIMDADFHKIYNREGALVNEPRPIEIGDKVWIGCRTTILKGARIPAGCVVGASSVVCGRFTEANAVIAGVGAPCTVRRSDIRWEL